TRMDGFNHDVVRLAPSLAKKIKTNKGHLFPDSEAMVLPGPLQSLRDDFGLADTLANHFQKRTYWTLLGLFSLVFAAIVMFGFYAHLAKPPAQLIFLALYLSVFTLAIGWFHVAESRDIQNKHQDYRALAEGLRVQFFWRLAGLHSSVADHYLRRQKSEIDWIRDSIRTWGMRVLPESEDTLQQGQQVLTYWVNDQRRYFKNSSDRDSKWSGYLINAGAGFLLVSLGMASWEASFGLPPDGEDSVGTAYGLVIAVILVFPVLYGIVHKLQVCLIEEGPRHMLMRLRALMLGVLGGLSLTYLFWAAPHHLSSNVAGYFKHHPQEWWIVAMVLTAAIPALANAYAEKRALSEHEKQYKHMELLFSRAQERLK
ncbi:MAG: hypothetical protein ACREXR_21295, partial [Gammaproteobacteria bacterium]